MDGDANHCLVHTLHSLGVPVVASTPGPFWALSDGNMMLKPFAKRLQHVTISMLHCGHYVMWCPKTIGCGHFTGMIITPTSVVVHDGGTTDIFSCAADVGFPSGTIVYKLVATGSSSLSVLEDAQIANIENNRETAL
jgi:hypothetical protein